MLGFVTDFGARALGWNFPSTGYLVGELIWKLGTALVLAWAVALSGISE